MAEHVIVPGFDSIIGQQLAVRLLQTFVQNGTLPHALLFTGGAGVGKRTTAKIVAMALNCSLAPKTPTRKTNTALPCGACRPCRQIQADSHPDVQLVEPDGTSFKINQVRGIIRTLAMQRFGDSQRIIIIAMAHTMTAEAANALLKILEEPPNNTTLILTAHQRADLLPTIVSRCQSIRFNPLNPEDLAALLTRTHQVDSRNARTIAALSGGSIARAVSLSQSQWQQRRDWLIQASGLDHTARETHLPIPQALAFAAHLAKAKDQIHDLLEMLKTWIRDLSVAPYYPEGLINGDLKQHLEQVRQLLSDADVLAIWQAVEEAQKKIAAKANLRLTLDIMALTIAGCMTKANRRLKR